MRAAYLPLLTSLLAGCSMGASDQRIIRAVGSSTVYPFTTAVAERFSGQHPELPSAVVEATGTGAGIKLFCAGIGARFPDIADASRRISLAERRDCAAHGVHRLAELRIGLDGIVIAQSAAAMPMRLTERDIYRAVAAGGQTRLWADVNPALPAWPILFYGPPAGSGTRDAFATLMLEKGCDRNAGALPARPLRCSRVRSDGRYVETGENDNLIVQKLVADPRAVGIFGYSFLKENAGRLRGVAINGVAPDDRSIAAGRYPGARPLYVYVKADRLGAVPGLRDFMAEYARAARGGSYLARRGLIAPITAGRALT